VRQLKLRVMNEMRSDRRCPGRKKSNSNGLVMRRKDTWCIIYNGLMISKREDDDARCRMMMRCGADRAVEVVAAVLMMMERLYKGGQNKKEQEDKG
jgi:hypothetical protein